MAFLDLGAILLCTMVKAAWDVFVSILKQQWDVTAPICLTDPWGSSHGPAPSAGIMDIMSKRGEKYICRSIYIYVCVASLFIKTQNVKRHDCLVLGTKLSRDSYDVPESSASVKAFLLDVKRRNSPKFTPSLVRNGFSTGSQVHSCGSCRNGL